MPFKLKKINKRLTLYIDNLTNKTNNHKIRTR